MTRFSVCGLQLDLAASGNLERLEREARHAKVTYPWIDMIVFGELAVHGLDPDFAEPADGPTEQRLRRLADRLGVWLVPGSMFERDGDHVYNTAPVIDPSGDVVARYRKLFPWLPWEAGVTPGGEHVVWDVPDVGRFGISICYDSWFPETTRALAWLGAEAIIHPTATSTVDRGVELVLARANAAMNQCWWVEVNSAAPLAVGQSIVTGPEGEVVHQSGAGSELVTAQVDLSRVREVRERGSFNLNQVLKSLRDSTVSFPQYGGATPARTAGWDGLGPLQPASGRIAALAGSQLAG
jgi:deaminated glutathione amidase